MRRCVSGCPRWGGSWRPRRPRSRRSPWWPSRRVAACARRPGGRAACRSRAATARAGAEVPGGDRCQPRRRERLRRRAERGRGHLRSRAERRADAAARARGVRVADGSLAASLHAGPRAEGPDLRRGEPRRPQRLRRRARQRRRRRLRPASRGRVDAAARSRGVRVEDTRDMCAGTRAGRLVRRRRQRGRRERLRGRARRRRRLRSRRPQRGADAEARARGLRRRRARRGRPLPDVGGRERRAATSSSAVVVFGQR